MHGPDIQQDSLFSTVSPESRVPKDHPLRPIRAMTDAALHELDQDFNALYADSGRDSIPPEKLLRAQLLMAFYTISSERQLMEGQLGFRKSSPISHCPRFRRNRGQFQRPASSPFRLSTLDMARHNHGITTTITQKIDSSRVCAHLPWIRRPQQLS